MSTNTAFALGLITSALQMIFVMLSWILTTYFGRRSIYLWGTGFNVVMLFALGIAASVGTSTAANNAQASFGLIVSVAFTFAAAPVSWCIIAETSAIRLRPLTTGIGRASYYIIEIPCIFREYCISHDPEPAEIIQSARICSILPAETVSLTISASLSFLTYSVGGKCGFVWGGTAFFTLVVAYFCLPEMKGRSYREIDIMFKRRLPARKFEKTILGMEEDE
jgi:SP family general alpha glucoside:H+ symporter-like MFS transporter